MIKKKRHLVNEEKISFREDIYNKLSLFLSKRNVCKYGLKFVLPRDKIKIHSHSMNTRMYSVKTPLK